MTFGPIQISKHAFQFLTPLGLALPAMARATVSTEGPSMSLSVASALMMAAGLSAAGYTYIKDRQVKLLLKDGQKSVDLAHALVANATDAIVTISEAGLVMNMNPAAEELFQYSVRDLLGKNVAVILPPPERGRRRENYIQNPGSHELNAALKDGTRLPVEVAFSVVSMDDPKVFSLIIRNLKNTRNKQETLHHQHDMLSEIVANAGMLLCVIDRNGKIIHFNRACEQLTDFSFGEINKQCIWDVMAVPEASEEMKEQYSEYFRGPFPIQTQSIWVARDLSSKRINWTYTTLKDSYGQAQFLIASGMPVPAVESAPQITSQTDKMEVVGRLAGGLAHDFNNLLTAITGYSGLILGSIQEQDPIRHDVEEIRKASDRGAQITRQLLALSRKQILNPRDFDLNEVLQDLEIMFKRILGESIHLEFDLGKVPAIVRADQTQIEQAIINVVVNARDAMQKGGKLTIATKCFSLPQGDAYTDPPLPPGKYCGLRITDTGVGMDAETRGHIFEPFFPAKDGGTGLGLGLATVYGIVRQCGGALSVTSRAGEGTSFLIYLQRGNEVATSAETKRGVLKLVPKGSETVLVAESDEILRNAITRGLTQYGYTVLAAVSAEDAVQRSKQHEGKIHLLVLDAFAPSIGGPALSQSIRLERQDARTLYITTQPADQVVRYGLSPSNTFVVGNKFDAEGFAEKVRELLDVKSMSVGAS